MFKTNATFSKNLDRATSNLLLSPDWDAILAICDTLRQGDCAPKPAVEAIKRKLQDKNPHIALYALQVLDAVVKNCGKPVHDEVITMSFMEELRDLAKRGPDEVRNRVLEVIQCWAHGFRDKPQYRVAQDTVNLMKLEGYKFPLMKEADALFVAESAPDWVEGDCCHRCRTDFSLTNRRHHCRNCGQIFCSKCSSKVSALPNYGIEKEVRVCDPCFESINQSKAGILKTPPTSDGKTTDLPAEYLASSLSKEPQAPVKKSKEEIQEEEELQLALAISQSEAEAKNKQTKNWNSPMKKEETQQKMTEIGEEPLSHTNGNNGNNGNNGHLDKYLNRKYWEEKQKESDRILPVTAPFEPSAPTPSSTPSLFGAGNSSSSKSEESYQTGESEEIQQFVSVLKSQINIFTNRMRSNVNRGRPLVNDPTMVALFNNLLPMRQQLMDYIQTQEHWKEYYERIQEKLIRLKEAREALDTLREEHREDKRREAEERHRLMQMQMVAKLDTLRLKKREYLEYQRQVAFQQMQAQEQELMRRKQMSSYQPYAFVPGGLASRPQMQPTAYQTQPQAGPQMGMPPPYSVGHPGYHNPQQVFQPIGQAGGAVNTYYSGPSMHPGQPGVQVVQGVQGPYQPQPGQDFQSGQQQPQLQQGGPYAPPGGQYQPGPYQAAPPVGVHYNQHPQQNFQPIPQQQLQQQQPQQPGYYAGPVQQQQQQQQQQHLPTTGQEAPPVSHLPIPVTEEQPLISFD